MIQKMNLKHRQLARRLLMGESQKKAAKYFGYSECHLSRIVHSPVYIRYVDDLEREADHEALDVIEHLRKHSEEAVNILIKLLKSPESSNREKYKAAIDILRFGGYDRPQPHLRDCSKRKTFEQLLREEIGDFDGYGKEAIDDMADDAE